MSNLIAKEYQGFEQNGDPRKEVIAISRHCGLDPQSPEERRDAA
jgi:hypothetical protein